MTTKLKATKKSKAKSAKPRSTRAAMSVATSDKETVKARVAAMAEVPLAVCESDKDLQSMLSVLRDQAQPIEVRLAALQSLQAASFSVVAFESCRSDYIATLTESRHRSRSGDEAKSSWNTRTREGRICTTKAA